MIFANKPAVKPILQFAATECGVAALAMLLAYYGRYVSMESLREECGAARDGTSMATLIEVAEAHGMKAEAYKVELSDIAALRAPIIAYWRFQHYVVITHVTQHNVYINDPAQGAVIVSHADFDNNFTGIIIYPRPDEHFKKVKAPAVVSLFILQWLRQYSGAFIFLIISMMLGMLLPVVGNRLNTIFIDYCLLGGNVDWLLSLLPVTIMLTVTVVIITYLQKSTQFRLVLKAGMMQTGLMVRHVIRLPMLFFALRQKPEITALMMRAEMVTHAMYQVISNAVVSMAIIVAILVSLFMIDVQLSQLLLVQFFLLIMPVRYLLKRNREYEQSNVEQLGKYYSFTLSTMNSLETIKINGTEAATLQKWVNALYGKLSAVDQSNRLVLLLESSSQAFTNFSTLVTLSIGSYKAAHGSLTLGGLFAFYSMQLYLTTQLWNILHLARDLQHAAAGMARMHDVLRYPLDQRFLSAPQQADHDGEVSCQNVSFSYSRFSAPVVRNINMYIRSGEQIALVGATGSGKSTLARLVAQLYHPTSGRLATLHPDQIAYVSQEVNLFSGTIHDNLTLWCDKVDPDVIAAAIHDACLTSLIAERGLYGKVEERGRNFSGGERQRIDIARALIQCPRLLILDEATAALDQETEASLLRHLRARGITILFVAHRLTSVRHCDQIHVMQNGHIIESGRHKSLAARPSFYQMLLSQGETADVSVRC